VGASFFKSILNSTIWKQLIEETLITSANILFGFTLAKTACVQTNLQCLHPVKYNVNPAFQFYGSKEFIHLSS